MFGVLNMLVSVASFLPILDRRADRRPASARRSCSLLVAGSDRRVRDRLDLPARAAPSRRARLAGERRLRRDPFVEALGAEVAGPRTSSTRTATAARTPGPRRTIRAPRRRAGASDRGRRRRSPAERTRPREHDPGRRSARDRRDPRPRRLTRRPCPGSPSCSPAGRSACATTRSPAATSRSSAARTCSRPSRASTRSPTSSRSTAA